MCTGVDIIEVVHLVCAVAQCRIAITMWIETIHLKIKIKKKKENKKKKTKKKIWSVLWPSVELLSLCGLKPFTYNKEKIKNQKEKNLNLEGAVAQCKVTHAVWIETIDLQSKSNITNRFRPFFSMI